MNGSLEQYIDSGYIYRFSQGPDVVRSHEDARRNGINCIALVHLALRDLFDCHLPPDLMCAELYADREHFDTVDDLENMLVGDLVWFGVENPAIAVGDFAPHYIDGQLLNWGDFPVKHVAIYTGDRDSNDDYLLLHSSHEAGTNVVWPMAKFRDYSRYKELYGISRIKEVHQKFHRKG